ncbi:hypothetical protein Tco_1335887 [Tanacetum coccineum]
MVAYLQKSEGSEGFHQIIDFLNASHIQYALTENPTIYVSFIKQFWKTATARTSANGEVELTATIDGQVKTITEASLRRHLKLEDNGGITTLPNSEIFEQLALMGIVVSDDVEGLEDPSKQGRKITKIDQDPSISLVHNEGTSWIQEDIEIQEKVSDDTKVVLEEEEPTELVKDQGSGEKGEKEVSTVGAKHSTVISEKQEVVTEADPTHVIDWSDPAVLRYHAQLNRPYSVAEVRKNMGMGSKISILCIPMGSEKEKGSEKKGSRKKSLARKRAGEKQSEESIKRQKIEDDMRRKNLKPMDLVPREEFAMEIESMGTKYPTVDWKTRVITKNFMYYQIIRADGGSKNYKIFSEMLDDFDKQDVMDLHRLVKERYATSRPEG